MQLFKYTKPILTSKQIERMANIFDNAGQVVFGVMVLSPLISGIENVRAFVIITGIGGTGVCWFTSVILARREK